MKIFLNHAFDRFFLNFYRVALDFKTLIDLLPHLKLVDSFDSCAPFITSNKMLRAVCEVLKNTFELCDAI